VSASSVRRYVTRKKHELRLTGREVFVPQSYHLGVEAQVDWFEAVAILSGVKRKVQMFAMRSMHSGAAYHCAFHHATQQAFLEAHELAFSYFGGVCAEWQARHSAHNGEEFIMQRNESGGEQNAICNPICSP